MNSGELLNIVADNDGYSGINLLRYVHWNKGLGCFLKFISSLL